MAIVKMKHLRLMAMQQDREELLHLLQRMGCVEIDEPSVDRSDPEWEQLKSPDLTRLTRARERQGECERALAALKRCAPEKGGLLQPRPELTERELFEPERLARGEQAVTTILDTERRIAALHAEQAKLTGQRESLAPWLPLDVPLDTQSTRETCVSFGTLPAALPLSEAEGRLQAQTDLAALAPAGSDQEYRYLLLVCHASVEDTVNQTLKELGWSRVAMRGWTGTAAENDLRLANELKRLDDELRQAEQSLQEQVRSREDVRRAADCAAVDISREESRCRLVDTGSTFFLEGWVPQDSWDAVARALEGYLCAWEMTDPAPEEYPKVPIKLKNSIFSRCMNTVTEMYSLPAYDGIDPNPLMAPFFILFFGVMMADMGYGILMVAASVIYLRRAKPKNAAFMEMIFWCGISTFIVGALTGGFFGDFIPQLLKIINPESTFEMPALLSPLDDIVTIMIGSLALGVIQIFTGMGISVVKKVRSGEFIDALFSEITWWIILAGLAIWICGMMLPSAPAVLGTVGQVVLILGALMLVLGGTRNAKGFGKVTCLVGLVYNGVTGYFSDILSYIRLMALMVSGSVIASVFNTLGATFGNVVLFIIISMLGNALNFALNLLGCYVHDLRLQCLEFFGRFYMEGGKPFRPLEVDTKYVSVIKEEM